MDASTTLASAQVIVIWAMLGLLLAWMVIFAVLAFCPHPTDLDQSENGTTSSRPFSVTPASTMLHVIASQSIAKQIESDRHDTPGEMETVSAI